MTAEPHTRSRSASVDDQGLGPGLIGIRPAAPPARHRPTRLRRQPSVNRRDPAGRALSFVIDAVAIIEAGSGDAPDVSVPPTRPSRRRRSDRRDSVIEPGQTVAVHLVAFSAADGKQLDSSWGGGTPLTFVPGAGAPASRARKLSMA